MTLEEAIKNKDYYTIYEIYRNKNKTTTRDYALECLSYLLCILYNGGNIYTTKSNKTTVLDCIYDHDFKKAYSLSNDEVIKSFLKDILDINDEIIKENVKGNYNYLFYDYVDKISDDFNNSNEESLKEDVINYLYNIGRGDSVLPMQMLLPFIYKYNQIKYLLHILSLLTYPNGRMDQDILFRWYEIASLTNDIENSTKILGVLLLIDPENKKIYNYLMEKEKNTNSEYLKRKIEFRNGVISEINHSISTLNTVSIPYSDEVDEFIIENELKNSKKVKGYRGANIFFITPRIIRSKKAINLLQEKAQEELEDKLYYQAILDYKMLIALKDEYDIDDLMSLKDCFHHYNDYTNERVIKRLINEINYLDVVNNPEYTESRSTFNYLVPNIDAIIFEVIDKGKYAKDVIKKYNLSEVDEEYAFVIMAREYFKKGYDKLGEEMLQIAKKNRNREDKELLQFIDEVDHNKKFYKNRTYETFMDIMKLELK